ncbi:unnamed protein product [Absidia cylindrospora]
MAALPSLSISTRQGLICWLCSSQSPISLNMHPWNLSSNSWVYFLQVSSDICRFWLQTRDAYIFCREDKVKLHPKSFKKKKNPCLEGKDRPLRGPAVRH